MKLLSRVLPTLLLYYLTSASTISLPAQVSENSSGLSIPVNQSNPISPLPPVPRGFTVDYIWRSTKPLNPLGVYVIAIKLMYGLTLQPWFSQVELFESGLCIVTRQPEYNIIIFTSDEAPSTALTTGMVVTVLYEAITDMATHQPGFFQIAGVIELHGKRIGKMFIDSSDLDVSNPTSTADSALSIKSPHVTEPDLDNSTHLSNFNEITDPTDRRFKITWQWDGKNIPAQDIFSAALNGLATVAQYDAFSPCEYVTALSTSGNAVFHIGRSTHTTLFCAIIARTFYLLINRLFLVQRRFEELWIYMSINGVNIADGYLHKVQRVGGGNATEGVASE